MKNEQCIEVEKGRLAEPFYYVNYGLSKGVKKCLKKLLTSSMDNPLAQPARERVFRPR